MGCECNKPEENVNFEINSEMESDFDDYNNTNFRSANTKKPSSIGPLSTFRNCRHVSSELQTLLEQKLKSPYGEKISFTEIIPEEFTEVLESSPANLYNIFTSLTSELSDINDIDGTKYKNIMPIKVIEPSGEVQYYQGSYNDKGQCHGKGLWTKDNNLYYGNFKNDEFSGKGIFVNEKGEFLIGRWENGKCNGQGKLYLDGQIVYKGGFKNNKKEGIGEEHYPGGDVYKGSFYNNQKNGKGTYAFADGSIYQGNFKDSKYNGFGEFKWSGGRTFKGEFKNGKIDGHGNFDFGDGNKFEGDFTKNKKQGGGEYTWGGKQSYKGQFTNNRVIGNGHFYDRNQGINTVVQVE